MHTALLDQNLAQTSDHARCRAMLRTGSYSFHMAAQFLPIRVRHPVTVIYAFCRLADDGVDLAANRVDALARLTDRLDRIYQSRPYALPVDRAMSDIVKRFQMPRVVFDTLFEGFQWDSQVRRYDRLEDTLSYSFRVAGTVGIMMCLLMGVRAPKALARACDLGLAMQLTNIARDVGEDANAGRLYLPREWMIEAGLEPEQFVRQPQYSAALATVIERLLQTAEHYYARGQSGIRYLPAACRPSIRAAASIYREIGRKLARRGFDSVSRRTVVTGSEKLRLALGAWLPSWVGRRERTPDHPALADAEPLIAAVAAMAEPGQCPPDKSEWFFRMWAELYDWPGAESHDFVAGISARPSGQPRTRPRAQPRGQSRGQGHV